jgi:hypothetical protein
VYSRAWSAAHWTPRYRPAWSKPDPRPPPESCSPGYSIASLAGGLAYGARRWPGSPQRQAELLLIADVLVMVPAALVNNVAVIAASVATAGLCAAPLITAQFPRHP